MQLAPGAIDNAEQLLTKAEVGMRSGNFEAAQQDAIAAREAARQALAISEVKQVDTTEPPVLAPPEEKPPHPLFVTYQIKKNDNLWRIAAKPEFYGDPLLWPLLLKENRSQIIDADLLFPGQSLTINIVPTNKEISAARRHATTRGAWRLHSTERADLRYLE